MIREPRRLSVRRAVVVLAGGLLACGSSSSGSDGGGGAGGGGGGGGSGAGGSASGGGSGAGGGGAGGGADGGSSVTVACTTMQTAGNPPMLTTDCTETAGLLSAVVVDALRTNCATLVDAGFASQQQFVIGPCSHAHAVGGCSTQSGTNMTTTRWWYEDSNFTADDVRALCQGLGSAYTFIAP
jgi:hypothetical protein